MKSRTINITDEYHAEPLSAYERRQIADVNRGKLSAIEKQGDAETLLIKRENSIFRVYHFTDCIAQFGTFEAAQNHVQKLKGKS